MSTTSTQPTISYPRRVLALKASMAAQILHHSMFRLGQTCSIYIINNQEVSADVMLRTWVQLTEERIQTLNANLQSGLNGLHMIDQQVDQFVYRFRTFADSPDL
jgi:hypothetical protein